MAMCTSILVIFCFLTFDLALTDDRIYYDAASERRWNTPPELTPEAASAKSDNQDVPQPRFLPFSASFSLTAGSSNAHSLSVEGSNDGISLSQSQSSSSSSFENARPSISTSQSSSFSAGLSGISASDANLFNLNYPIFGGSSEVFTSSFALGQAYSSASGKIDKNQAITEAQSRSGSFHLSATSGVSMNVGNHQILSSSEAAASSHQEHSHQRDKPSWTKGLNRNIGGTYRIPPRRPVMQFHSKPQNWRQENVNRKPLRLDISSDDSSFQQSKPEVHIIDYRPPSHRNPVKFVSAASIISCSSSNSPTGISFSQSFSHSTLGADAPSSWTTDYGQETRNAQPHSQETSAVVGQSYDEKTQASFSSSSLSSSSTRNGHRYGLTMSRNRGQDSRGKVNNQVFGTADFQGSTNAGIVSFSDRSDNGNRQNIPSEFVRNTTRNPKVSRRNPIDNFFIDITDSVADLFDL